MSKPILCLDFDGVCHSYTSGWQGADVIPDPPVPGLFDFLEKANEFFDIQIFSSRSNQPGGQNAMWQWFCNHYTAWLFQHQPELKEKYFAVEPSWLSFPTEKPAAFVTIDDRAITFSGTFPEIDFLRSFQPWYRAGVPTPRALDAALWVCQNCGEASDLSSQRCSVCNTPRQ